MRSILTIAAVALLLFGCASHTADAPRALRVVGYSDLGNEGLNGEVAIVGTTAIVAGGITPAAGLHTHFYNPYPCPATAVKLVDLSVPATPRLVGRIAVPAGVAAMDVDALRVTSPAFTGDLAAIALARCSTEGNFIERGVVYYDVSDPSTPRFLGRYQADAAMAPDDAPPCGPKPEGSGARCASSQHSVALVDRGNGRILSLSTEPGASASGYPSGDLRIVDVSDPARPVEIASWPNERTPIITTNGCRPFSGGHAVSIGSDGITAWLGAMDDGAIAIDLTTPETPQRVAQFGYAKERNIEGNAGFVTETRVGGRRLALIAEEDWIAPDTHVTIDAPAEVAGRHYVCPAVFTLFDPERDAQLYLRADRTIAADVVYLGRGCPENPGSGGHAGSPGTDAHLGDVAGKIALIDRTRQPTQPDISAGAGCTVAERALRAQRAGAVAVLVAQTVESTPQAFSPDGIPDGLSIPVMHIDKPLGDALRSLLCPLIENGRCVGETVRATLTDDPGEWGALRIVDFTDMSAPAELATYRAPGARVFPPSDLGVYSVHHAVTDGAFAFVAASADGLRVLDLSGGATEIATFVPPDRADPTGSIPPKALVTGIALHPDGKHVVITDVNSGLYVLERPRQAR